MKLIIFLLILLIPLSVHADYFTWRKSITKDDTQGALWIPKGFIYCNSREQMVAVWNRIVDNGGNYSYNLVKSVWGCQFTQGMSIGRALKAEKNGLVQVEFLQPYSKENVFTVWTHRNMLQTLENYRHQRVR